MAPDWFDVCLDLAEKEHDPSEFGGREWDELSGEEQDRQVANRAEAFVAYLTEVGRGA